MVSHGLLAMYGLYVAVGVAAANGAATALFPRFASRLLAGAVSIGLWIAALLPLGSRPHRIRVLLLFAGSVSFLIPALASAFLAHTERVRAWRGGRLRSG
jgi:hypothetical protein